MGVYLDGVYLGRIGMIVTDLLDLERIEVLRGPQGTLFGKNATAGAVNIITRKPTHDTEGWAELTGGDYALRQFKGAISGPVGSDKLAYRLSGFGVRRQGFTEDTTLGTRLADLNRVGARAQLLWTPSASTSVRLIADYASQDEAGPGYLLINPNVYFADGSVRPNNFLDRARRAGYTPVFDPEARQTDAEAPQRFQSDQAGVSLEADWRLADLTLTSITAWRDWYFHPQNDGDGTVLRVQPVLGTDARDWQVSEELRLASVREARFDYLLGTLVFMQSLRSLALTTFGPQAADYFRPGLPSYVLNDYSVETVADPRTQSYAAFGQASWRPNDRGELTAGLRWTGENREALINRSSSGGAAVSPTDGAAVSARALLGGAAQADVHTSEGFLSGLLSFNWHLSKDVMAYASAARGAKSGGINVAVVPAGIPQRVGPEVATSYELGMKSEWLAQRVQINVSVFSTYVSDYQATVRDPIRGATFLTNAGAVRSRGFEVESRYRPIPELTLTLAGGWNDAHYTSFKSAPCPPEYSDKGTCDFSGQRVAGSPPWTVSSTLSYRTPIRNGRLVAFTDLDFLHSAGYQSDLSYSTYIEGYNLVNVRLGLGSSRDTWSLTFWVRNVFDAVYYTTQSTGGSFNVGVDFGLLGDPRTYGVSLRGQF